MLILFLIFNVCNLYISVRNKRNFIFGFKTKKNVNFALTEYYLLIYLLITNVSGKIFALNVY